jgi:hypothetical protein
MPVLSPDTSRPVAMIEGTMEDGVDIPSIFNFALLDDGTLAGFHRGDAVVDVISPTGQSLARHGVNAEGGPGFGFVVALADFGGDSLVATDLMNGRAVVLHPRGGVSRSFPAVFRDSANFQNIAGRFPSGTWLLRPSYIAGGGTRPTAAGLPFEPRPRMAVGRWLEGADLTRFDTLVLVPGWERVRVNILLKGEAVVADITPHFAARSHAVLWQGEAAIVTNADRSIRRYDEDGRLRSVIRIDAALLQTTDSVRQVVRNGLRRTALAESAARSDSSEEVAVAVADSIYRTMIFADSIAPYERMHLAPGRRLWLQETAIAPGDPARLIGFEPDGTIVGRLEVPLPPGGQIAAMGDDRVVVRVTVPDRRSYVRVWRIREQ